MSKVNLIHEKDPQYTNGICPHCEARFDVRKANLAFPGKFTGNAISLAFALCPECYDTFSHGVESQQADIINISFANIVKNKHTDWAVTSSLALNVHFGNFFNAWWYGVDLPSPIFDVINNGLVEEILFLPTWGSLNGFGNL